MLKTLRDVLIAIVVVSPPATAAPSVSSTQNDAITKISDISVPLYSHYYLCSEDSDDKKLETYKKLGEFIEYFEDTNTIEAISLYSNLKNDIKPEFLKMTNKKRMIYCRDRYITSLITYASVTIEYMITKQDNWPPAPRIGN